MEKKISKVKVCEREIERKKEKKYFVKKRERKIMKKTEKEKIIHEESKIVKA